MLKILAIESSCDETAVAIIRSDKKILSNIIISQIKEHVEYGGVVPEIAARAHLNYLPKIVKQAFKEAKLLYSDIDAIAVTGGPGLIGGVIVGVMFAKSLSYSLAKPFIAINHLEGHALTARLTSNINYPYLLLLMSGGHCQFVIVKNLNNYEVIGSTIDDAIGEAFDKVAKIMGYDYPGGPIIEKLALNGDELRFKLPKSLTNKNNCDFSFSGLKTAVRREVQALKFDKQDESDMAASFQFTISEIIRNKLNNALKKYSENYENKYLVIAGGVAANLYLRNKIDIIASEHKFQLITPPIDLCTDNAAMIGWAAIERIEAGYESNLNFIPKDRWSL